MNNREVATSILLGALAIVVVSNQGARAMIPVFGKQLFASKITFPLALWAATLLTAVLLADHLRLWSPSLLGATLLWCLLVGFVWFVNLGDASKDQDYFKRRMVETLGIAALLEFFVNAQVLPLLVELPGQAFLMFVVVLNVVASSDQKYKFVATLTAITLLLSSAALLVYSVVELIAAWDALDKRELLSELLLPIWLAATSLAVFYLIALYAVYESLFIRLSFLNDGSKPALPNRGCRT